MFKKIFAFCLSCILILTGCSSGPKDNEGNTLINIDDIKWEMIPAVIDGRHRVVFNYTNNTDYTITDLYINYRLKSDITESDMAMFDKYIEDGRLQKERINELSISAGYKVFAEPGESLSNNELAFFGYLFINSMDEADMFEPDYMEIDYILDDKLKTISYDFTTKTITENKIADLYQWDENDFTNQIEKPNARMVRNLENSDTTYSFEIYDMNLSDYKEYIKSLKESGFSDVDHEYYHDGSASYDASGKNGYSIDSIWDDYSNSVTVYIRKNK